MRTKLTNVRFCKIENSEFWVSAYNSLVFTFRKKTKGNFLSSLASRKRTIFSLHLMQTNTILPGFSKRKSHLLTDFCCKFSSIKIF